MAEHIGIPSADSEFWRFILFIERVPELKGLPTKLLLTRVRLLSKSRIETQVCEAIKIAHDYFSRNIEVCSKDLDVLLKAYTESQNEPYR